MNVLIKYYPLFSEVMARIVPLLKGDKSQESVHRLESALKELQKGMRETENWLLKREREILFLRWMAVTGLVISIINSILLTVFLSKIL